MARAKSWRAWLQADDDALERLRLAGATRPQIAAALGRTEGSVKGRLGEVEFPKVSPRRAAWLAELGRPHRNADVAHALGVTPKTVRTERWRLRRLGFTVLLSGAGIAQQQRRRAAG